MKGDQQILDELENEVQRKVRYLTPEELGEILGKVKGAMVYHYLGYSVEEGERLAKKKFGEGIAVTLESFPGQALLGGEALVLIIGS